MATHLGFLTGSRAPGFGWRLPECIYLSVDPFGFSFPYMERTEGLHGIARERDEGRDVHLANVIMRG